MGRRKKEPQTLDEFIVNTINEITNDKIKKVDESIFPKNFNKLFKGYLKRTNFELMNIIGEYLGYFPHNVDIFEYATQHNLDVRYIKDTILINQVSSKQFEDAEVVGAMFGQKYLSSIFLKTLRLFTWEAKKVTKTEEFGLMMNDLWRGRLFVKNPNVKKEFDNDVVYAPYVYPYFKPKFSENYISDYLINYEYFHDDAKRRVVLDLQKHLENLGLLIDTSDFKFTYNLKQGDDLLISLANMKMTNKDGTFSMQMQPIYLENENRQQFNDVNGIFLNHYLEKSKLYKNRTKVNTGFLRDEKFINFNFKDDFPKISLYRSGKGNEKDFFVDYQDREGHKYYNFHVSILQKNIHDMDILKWIVSSVDMSIETKKNRRDARYNAHDYLIVFKDVIKNLGKDYKKINDLLSIEQEKKNNLENISIQQSKLAENLLKQKLLQQYINNWDFDFQRTIQGRKDDFKLIENLLSGLIYNLYSPDNKIKGKDFKKSNGYKMIHLQTLIGELQIGSAFYDYYNYFFDEMVSHDAYVMEVRSVQDIRHKYENYQTNGQQKWTLIEKFIQLFSQRFGSHVQNLLKNKYTKSKNPLKYESEMHVQRDAFIQNILWTSKIAAKFNPKIKDIAIKNNIKQYFNNIKHYLTLINVDPGKKAQIAYRLYDGFLSQKDLWKTNKLGLSDDLTSFEGNNLRISFTSRFANLIAKNLMLCVKDMQYHDNAIYGNIVEGKVKDFIKLYKMYSEYYNGEVDFNLISKVVKSYCLYEVSSNPKILDQADSTKKKIIEQVNLLLDEYAKISHNLQGKTRLPWDITFDSEEMINDFKNFQDLFNYDIKTRQLIEKISQTQKKPNSGLDSFMWLGHDFVIEQLSDKYSSMRKELSDSGLINKLNEKYYISIQVGEKLLGYYNEKLGENTKYRKVANNQLNNWIKTLINKNSQNSISKMVNKINKSIDQIYKLVPELSDDYLDGVTTFLKRKLNARGYELKFDKINHNIQNVKIYIPQS